MNKKETLILLVVLTALTALRVFLPWPNFNPIGAVALMGGAFLGRRALAFAVPLLSLFLGDLILSQVSSSYSAYLFSSSFAAVYIAFALTVVIGMRISNNLKPLTVLGGSIFAVIAFFFITNTAAWMYFGMYPQDFNGLLMAWNAGIPFIKNTLISQVLFSAVLYGGYVLAMNRKPAVA